MSLLDKTWAVRRPDGERGLRKTDTTPRPNIRHLVYFFWALLLRFRRRIRFLRHWNRNRWHTVKKTRRQVQKNSDDFLQLEVKKEIIKPTVFSQRETIFQLQWQVFETDILLQKRFSSDVHNCCFIMEARTSPNSFHFVSKEIQWFSHKSGNLKTIWPVSNTHNFKTQHFYSGELLFTRCVHAPDVPLCGEV